MSDLISKNQSLVEWKEDFKGFVECLDIPRDDYKGIMEYIDEVPSVEPETPSNGSITSMNPENTHDRTMDDLISRKEAVGGIDK